MTKISEAKDQTLQKLLTLVRDIRPDQAANFAKADKFFVEQVKKQFGDEENADIIADVEFGLTYHSGDINIATIFSWLKLGRLKRFRQHIQKISREDYFIK